MRKTNAGSFAELVRLALQYGDETEFLPPIDEPLHVAFEPAAQTSRTAPATMAYSNHAGHEHGRWTSNTRHVPLQRALA
jgi:hypothetical protein